MIRINLLAADAIKKEERNELLVIGYVALCLLIVVGGIGYALKLRACKRLEARLAGVQQELCQYEAIVRQVEALQATKNVLETRKNVINTLMASRLVYPKFMEDLLGAMPSNIWFRTIATQVLPTGQMSVALDASALDNYAIADFIGTLSANPDFSVVELGPISTAIGGKPQVSAFRLTFNYQKKTQ